MVERHTFELALARDQALHAVRALSFESDDKRAIAREIESVAWSVDDIRKVRPQLPMTVLALEAKDSPAFARAEHIRHGLSANFIPSARIDDWASGAITELVLGCIPR